MDYKPLPKSGLQENKTPFTPGIKVVFGDWTAVGSRFTTFIYTWN